MGTTFRFTSCRLCNTEGDCLYQFFPKYSQILWTSLGIRIQKAAGLPDLVCSLCITTLTLCETFKAEIIKTQAELNNCINSPSGQFSMKACRLCLKPVGIFSFPIFGTIFMADKWKITLSEELLALLNVKIVPVPILPSISCNKCFKLFTKSFQLKETIVETNNILYRAVKPPAIEEIMINSSAIPQDSIPREEVAEEPLEVKEEEDEEAEEETHSKTEDPSTEIEETIDLDPDDPPYEVESDDEEMDNSEDSDSDSENETETPSKTVAPKRVKNNPALIRKAPDQTQFIEMLKERNILTCKVCKRNYPSYYYLFRHVKEKHDPQSYKYCCDRKLERQRLVKDHLMYHLDDKAFQCYVCGACFGNSKALDNHMRVSANHGRPVEPPLECETCQRKFRIKSELNEHIDRIHEGRVFPCEFCIRGFRSKCYLNQHVESNHQELRPGGRDGRSGVKGLFL